MQTWAPTLFHTVDLAELSASFEAMGLDTDAMDLDTVGSNTDEYELPGPASWWPEEYDPEKYGFYIPNAYERKGYELAWQLMRMPAVEVLRAGGVPFCWFATGDKSMENFFICPIDNY
jgi:hypothetical protein